MSIFIHRLYCSFIRCKNYFCTSKINNLLAILGIFLCHEKIIAEFDCVNPNSFNRNVFCFTDVLVEGKVAFFYPEDSRFRDIYPYKPLYSGEITANFNQCFAFWGSAGYYSSHGSSIGFDTPTTINILPLAIGIKYYYPLRNADLYAGLGGQYTRVHIHDHSNYVIQHLSRWGWGGIAKLGYLYYIKNNLFFDLFVDYSLLQLNFKKKKDGMTVNHHGDLNSWSFGIGIGYSFGK